MDALTCASGQNAHNPLRNIFDIRRAPTHIFVLHRRKHLGEIVTGHRNRILGIDLLRIDDILNRVQIVLVLQHDLVNLKIAAFASPTSFTAFSYNSPSWRMDS